ncbi:MAG TPA: amidohydrolase family protein [Streptosporangiaceae bacterium]|nr:amidohydrolase family protein [Streptosporangiaceae bacterium]
MGSVIRGGRIIDPATGQDGYSDLVIEADRIADVGHRQPARPGARVVEADGLLVLPGFIDIHTHSDFTLPVRPAAQARIRQGVTTDVTGNCGLSPFPVPPDRADFGAFFEPGLTSRWTDLASYAAALRDVRPAVNVAPLVGLGAVRLSVMADADRRASEAELDAMRLLVEHAMEQGAFGASTGLVYVPGRYAGPAEIGYLLKPVSERSGLYATHVRDERDRLLEAVEEAISTATIAGARLQLSHHKAIGRQNWGRTEQTLAMVDAANATSPIEAAVDFYPYTAGSTGIVSLLPPGALAAGIHAFTDRLREPRYRAEVTRHIEHNAQFRMDEIIIGQSHSRPAISGMPLSKSAGELGVRPADLVLDLVAAEGEQLVIIGEAASDDDLRRVLAHGRSMHGSDAWLMSDDQTSYAHPRNFASALRLLACALIRNVLPLSTAVDKLTRLPARRLGLTDRGTLRPGAFADVVVIDPAQLTDEADFLMPCRYPDAVRWAFVNGTPVIEDGNSTPHRPGRILQPT